MGNILTIAADHRADIAISALVLSLVSYLVWDAMDRRKFRAQLLQHKIKEPKIRMNQIYLKDTVDHLLIRQNAENPIFKIAITGGPCAGKSTSMKKIQKIFSDKGYRVFAVPQIPTMIVLSGGMILMSKFNAQERIRFQSLLIRFQMYIEDYITKLAQMSKSPSIVLCDRGTMDPQAYITKQQFQSILDEQGWSKVVLRDRRYDRVIFLCSAANGAQQFYTLENNEARSEGVQAARNLDLKTLEAWVGHPHLTIVPNAKGQTFDDKINRAIRAVEKTVGIQVTDSHYAKVLIRKPQYPQNLHVEHGQRIDIFLKNDRQQFDQDKLTQWGQNHSYCYQRKFRCKRKNVGEYSRQLRKPLTSTQFVTLRENADPSYNALQYKRSKFNYNYLCYTVDCFNVNDEQIYVLRYFCNKQQTLHLVPPFLQTIRDVSHQKQYTVKYLAKKK